MEVSGGFAHLVKEAEVGGIWPLVSVGSNIQVQISLAGSSVLRNIQAQAQGPVGPAQSDTQPAPQPHCPHWDSAPPPISVP